ncbi:MAG: heme exporter protein CcmD [Gammaproteobacteria bacterium]|jgi:heme exporter protein CcmD
MSNYWLYVIVSYTISASILIIFVWISYLQRVRALQELKKLETKAGIIPKIKKYD